METRALIHRLRTELLTKDPKTKVHLYTIYKVDEDNNIIDEIYEYNEDEIFRFVLEYRLYPMDSTLGGLMSNAIYVMRPAMRTSIQVEQDPVYWMNEDVMLKAFEISCRFNDISEEYKENDREYYQFPEEYADYLRYFCRDDGIKLSMRDCCEQDIFRRGEQKSWHFPGWRDFRVEGFQLLQGDVRQLSHIPRFILKNRLKWSIMAVDDIFLRGRIDG